MSNHTPGPWRAIFGGSIGHYSVNTDARGYSMRTVVSGVRERDAFLIAQAPNLLKIAEMVERVIQLGNATEDSDEALKQWFEAQEELGELVMETLKEVRGEHE